MHADVASLFLVDLEKKELYSKVFEHGVEEKICFPMSVGISGAVATTGKTINLKDAHDDARFNPEIDKRNNYRTKSYLSVAINGADGKIVGVCNLINKIDQETGEIIDFSEADKSLFESFSVFCGLALSKTMMMEETIYQKQRLSLLTEMLSFHSAVRPEDLARYIKNEPELLQPLTKINEYLYDPHIFHYTDETLAALGHQMFLSLAYDKTYRIPDIKLVEYILTVRHNYRPVVYHNFTHAISVTHGLYVLIINGVLDKYFDKLELFSMMIAALNHDIDHRGTNNSFQKKAGSVLGNFYSTSTMERHHFNHALMIMNSHDGLNILESLTTTEYKRCLGVIEASILATDLMSFFDTKKKVAALLKEGSFEEKNETHLGYLRGVVMTCSDLAAMYKPFEINRHTADTVYQEFFLQGDEEKKMGLPYSADLMNREKEPEIPRMQVDFMNFVVIPAFECLQSMLGEPVTHLVDGVKKNCDNWRELMNASGPYKMGSPN
ncbi:hypothetical protein BC833DRAFT_4356 [Globomyces pollinis-pini]|nr:hypothetical protein BC833DRAFT_4356 [Globomyces pollinis-pini]